MPKNAIVKKLITRPRLSSSTSVWMRVFTAAIVIIIPAPTATSSTSESATLFEREKATSPTPNVVPATVMTRSRFDESRRDASQSAPAIAPTPVAPVRMPSVFAPP